MNYPESIANKCIKKKRRIYEVKGDMESIQKIVNKAK